VTGLSWAIASSFEVRLRSRLTVTRSKQPKAEKRRVHFRVGSRMRRGQLWKARKSAVSCETRCVARQHRSQMFHMKHLETVARALSFRLAFRPPARYALAVKETRAGSRA